MMKRKNKIEYLVLTALMIILGTQKTLAQSDSVIVKPDIVYSTDRKTYLLGGFVVDGIKGYDDEVLRNISGLEVGQAITVPGDDISRVLHRYWDQKIFSDVTIAADSIVGHKIYLHITLAARPKISTISYHGVKKSEREDIEERLGLRSGSQISPDIVDRAKIIIKRYFEEKGYKNAIIEIVQKDDVSATNQVIVDVNIDKNEKIKVKHIYFTGVKKEYVKKLKRAMKKTHEVNKLYNLFKSKKFLPEEYEKDKGLIIDKYNEWGYRDAIINTDSVVPYDEKHVDIYINIDEGNKYYLRNVEWVGNSVYSSESLAQALKMKRGDVYNQKFLNKRLVEDEDAIGNQYYNNGYVFYNLNPVEVNIDGDSVDLEMRIYEGQQATLNNIRISGNTRVYENVIRRELRTKPGDLFKKDAIMRSIRELANMQFFDPEKIEPDIKPDQENGTVDINYKLEPKASDQVQLSFGWGQTGIVGTVGLKFTNFSMQNLFSSKNRRALFPQGDGQQLSLNAQTNAKYYQSYSFNFLDPWFGGKRPNQLSFSIFYSKQTDVNSDYYNSSYYNSYNQYLYGYGMSDYYNGYYNYYDPDTYVKIFGVSLGWGTRLRWPDDFFSLMLEATYMRYMLKSWKYFIISDGNCNNFNIGVTINRSSIDNNIFPRSGSEFTFSVSATPPYSLWDGKDYSKLAHDYRAASYQKEMQEKYRWVEYHKWKLKFRSYTALSGKTKCPVLMTRTDFGLLGHYNKHKKSPFETFYVGGDGMSGYSSGYATETIGLRGYENGCLTPSLNYEGYAYSRLTLELRYPLMLKGSTNIYALAFAEGGNAWNDIKKFNPFDMKRSAGVGVRVFLPMIGLMGLDWAYGFDKVFGTKSNSGSHIHFIIGQEF